jgi:Domain of unknown function (DUF397)
MKYEFRKSSHSGEGAHGTCVEVAANVPGARALRDSKDPRGPVLEFHPAEFGNFISTIKTGRFDR